jgi:tetratricopeptide (TPR) repeat protein
VNWTLRYALALSNIGKQKDAFEVIAKVRRSRRADQFVLRTELVEAAVAESASDYERECKIAEFAEKAARSKGLTYQVGHAELSEGWALDNLSKFNQAQGKVSDARDLLHGIGDEGGEAQALKLLGDVYADQNRLDLAKSLYTKAASDFHKIGWQSGEAVALNNCGYVLRDLGDLQGARDSFEQSLLIARSLGDLRRQGLALNGAAIVLKRMGNFVGAAEAYSASIEIAAQLYGRA